MPSAGSASKLIALKERVARLESVVVAFSGGVDSALVLKIAVDALESKRVLAATARSASVPRAELETVAALAEEIGARHAFVDTHEFDNPDYLANPSNRCYFCKDELYSHLTRLADQRGFKTVINGVNADDLGDFRPGIKAADQHRVCAPLVDCDVTKTQVREIAAALGLSIHDKPASPCLSSRVQYGESITPEKLRQIDEAESFLRTLGFRELRVRHHANLARIEVPLSDLARFADPELRERVSTRLREIGYQYVTLDLRGFRSGSMNEVLLGRGFAGE